MTSTTIGLDIGKSVFHVIGLDGEGTVVLRKRLPRGQVPAFFAKPPPFLIGMEAGCGAHWLARELVGLGHDPRLMPAQSVRPYVKSHKNDARDAEAIIKASTQPTMRFVEIKWVDQVDRPGPCTVRATVWWQAEPG